MTISYPLAASTWDDEERRAIERVLAGGRHTMGPEVAEFERQFADHFGSRHAVMVNSGSSANLLGIAAAFYHPDYGLADGDEVIVPAVSWSTTYFPIHQCRLRLRFVDIARDTLNLDPDLVEAAITSKTKAIFAVNLLGNPCHLNRLRDICARHSILLFEDNCESMGAVLDQRQAGTFGTFGTFSSFFSHHICTMEGGIVLTDDTKLYHTMLSLRAHGWTREQPRGSHLTIDADDFTRQFRFVLPGYNLRPLELEGALGQSQLRKLPELIRQRRMNAEIFVRLFESIPGIRIQRENGQSSWFAFALILDGALALRRAELVELLQAHGVECRPLVAGNFLSNPVMKHLDHSIAGPTPIADEIDRSGFFIGNHHFSAESALHQIGDLVRAFSDRHHA